MATTKFPKFSQGLANDRQFGLVLQQLMILKVIGMTEEIYDFFHILAQLAISLGHLVIYFM
jgi:hypothetical protein